MESRGPWVAFDAFLGILAVHTILRSFPFAEVNIPKLESTNEALGETLVGHYLEANSC